MKPSIQNPYGITNDQALAVLSDQQEWGVERRHVAKQWFLAMPRNDLLATLMLLGAPTSGRYSPDTSTDALLTVYSPAQLAAIVQAFADNSEDGKLPRESWTLEGEEAAEASRKFSAYTKAVSKIREQRA